MFTTRPELSGTFGMVASTHWLASAAGMAILERGGNAADAAVAAGFVLQVVEPHLNGLGGDANIMASAGSGPVRVFCGQGVTPATATLDSYLALGLDLVPGTGPLAATVPGAFGAWLLLLREQGTLSLRDVLEAAIGYAENGYPLVPNIVNTIASVEELFRTEWPTSAQTYLAGGLPKPGQRFTNPALATTYRRILAEAEAPGRDREAQIDAALDAFYRGFVAEEIAAFVSANELMDSSGNRHRGFLTADDLAQWQPTVEAPLTVAHDGIEVHKAGPWSQGPVLLQQLALVDHLGIGGMAHLSADWIHTITEAAKLAFADREAWYGDPDAGDVPIEALLSPGYTSERASLIGDTASLELRPGSPGGRTPVLPTRGAVAAAPVDARGTGEPTVRGNGLTSGDTCHVDVVDKNGMLVSATPSGGWLQSSPVIPSLGLSLGTRAQMLWLEPGLPASMAPGVRPRTTLTPSIASIDGTPFFAFGTPGGDQQDQWSLSFLLAYLHGERNLQAAIDAPMFHTTHFPSSFYPRAAHPGHIVVEDRVDAGVLRELEARGHVVDVAPAWSQGRLSGVLRDPVSGFLKAGANPRGMQGYAVGR
ncbi:gamma-glutamyltransferase family protein [Gryllotalpicola reticulitermitis]|uniref:Gamma-glutamyltransferase family protein n=1 Tax=Gryllotalpicola reticulitermitis TaxID=1184153 RepID=A0ABV8Q8Q7_9MICO